ncbi:pyridoxal phosphate-dependent aminotransferase family protein [Maribacter sp.]|nr:pyridoxal phosphate-dependent aminotransferase family protein [Maribacter sp.]
MNQLPKKLLSQLEVRERQNALRSLPTASELVDFSSNDYLGFACDPTIVQKAEALLTQNGIVQNGATGSRLLSGNHQLYYALERTLAILHDAESALIFNSGYDANLGFFGSVPQRGDIVFYDEFIHASIRDGIQLGHAKSYKFKHNDVDDLKKKYQIERNRSISESEIYVVTESVFSMDGDSPDLIAFADFSIENNCHLVVDEAHAVGAFGTNGAGLIEQYGLAQKVFARIITFGKAFGCHGSAILGGAALKTYLVNFARSFIYTTGLPPHSVATIMATYERMIHLDGNLRRKQLQDNIGHFNLQVSKLKLEAHFIPSLTPIHSCVVSGNEKVKFIAGQLQQSGFDIRAICSPTVPKNRERLRFCLHSYNTADEIDAVLRLLVKFTSTR